MSEFKSKRKINSCKQYGMGATNLDLRKVRIRNITKEDRAASLRDSVDKLPYSL